MQQFVLPELPPTPGAMAGAIALGGADYHYLINVRRLAIGDSFPAVDRNGSRYSSKTIG